MNTVNTTLVVGATGLLGGEIVRLLRSSGRRVRAVVRPTSNPERVAVLAAAGAELVTADLKDSATLAAACAGVSSVISTASASASRQAGDDLQSVDHEGQLALVANARAAAVERFVFTSFPPVSVDTPFQRAKRAVEASIRESGMAYSILQPTFFTEVWLSPMFGFEPLSGSVRIFGTGEQRVRWISVADVARLAVAASNPGAFDGRTLPLGGPDPLSMLEVVSIFEDLGAKVTKEFVPVPALVQQLHAAVDPVVRSLTAVSLLLASGELGSVESAVDFLPGRMSSVRDYAIRLLGSGKAS